MRPQKTRWVKCQPLERCFNPRCKPLAQLQSVLVTLDEFEALRLADLEGLKQEAAAKLMRISRPTFCRIVTLARKKVAEKSFDPDLQQRKENLFAIYQGLRKIGHDKR